ncbi:hypothetical protein JAO29_03905 [Edaphobacter sp. HDX4]|uniref:hypothetical protein n=1 Tax=Edaphobacter sp. HDX4 TaxID=2794064 RepID=UPI002FE5FA03
MQNLQTFLKYLPLVPGAALIRRRRPTYAWGEVVYAQGFLTGTPVSFDKLEFTFQKGKGHYGIALISKLHRTRPQGSMPPDGWFQDEEAISD